MEWCADIWNNDVKKLPINGLPNKDGKEGIRVVRGESLFSFNAHCRVANRFRDIAGNRNYNMGFRFIRSNPWSLLAFYPLVFVAFVLYRKAVDFFLRDDFYPNFIQLGRLSRPKLNPSSHQPVICSGSKIKECSVNKCGVK